MLRQPLLVVVVIALLVGCAQPRPTTVQVQGSPAKDASSGLLHQPFAAYGFDRNPQLLERLLESAYGYFRFTNIGFSEEVCQRFADVQEIMPIVNLHGDAHLENYAVTTAGRGLVDYDDASSGPAIMDLIRFAASMYLLAELRGWDAEPAVAALFEGYRGALEDPTVDVPEPVCAKRLRDAFGADRSAFLAYTESLMLPIAPPQQASFQDGFARYAELLHATQPELPADFFTIVRAGYFNTGYGSALAHKYLIRVRGQTDAPADDVVLEAKEVRDLSSISCISTPTGTGAFRILLSQTRIGKQSSFLMAEVPRRKGSPADTPPFWVQPWQDNYHELSVDKTLHTVEEMAEVARDVGGQLGRGHVVRIASPFDGHLRRAQLQVLDELDGRVQQAARELAKLTLHSWQKFREQAGAVSSPSPAAP